MSKYIIVDIIPVLYLFFKTKYHFDFKFNVKINVKEVTMVSVHLNTFRHYYV